MAGIWIVKLIKSYYFITLIDPCLTAAHKQNYTGRQPDVQTHKHMHAHTRGWMSATHSA